MSWSHIDTESSRKPAGSDFTRPVRPTSPTNPIRLEADSSVLLPAVGCGFPLASNQPTPPPRIRTHSGLVCVPEEPILVPITNVW